MYQTVGKKIVIQTESLVWCSVTAPVYQKSAYTKVDTIIKHFKELKKSETFDLVKSKKGLKQRTNTGNGRLTIVHWIKSSERIKVKCKKDLKTEFHYFCLGKTKNWMKKARNKMVSISLIFALQL